MNLKWGSQSFFIHIYSFHWPKLTWRCSNTTLTTSFKKGLKMLSLLITQPVTSISCSSFHFLNSLFSKLQILNKEVSNIRLSNKYRRWQLTSYRIYKYKKARKWNHRTSDEFHVPVNVMWHVRNRDMLRLNSGIFTIFDPREWHESEKLRF